MTKEEFESRVQSLVGEQIKKVNYYEMIYSDHGEYWGLNPDFDSLDYGVDFEMESGAIKGIIWGNEFYQYGISLIPGSLDTELERSSKIDVSYKNRWLEVIGKKIKSAKIIWASVEEGRFKKKIYYPENLILTFGENNMVCISALEIGDDSYFAADNITVFFDESIARKYCDINT